MKKRWPFVCLFSLVFLVFFAGAANEIWERHTVSRNDFIQLTGANDPFEEFSKEIITVLAEALPDKQNFDEVCEAVYLREDVYHDEILITLYVEGNDDKNVIIWSMEKRKMKNRKAIREFAQEAAYLLLRRLGQDRSIIIKPTITAPAAKIIVL